MQEEGKGVVGRPEDRERGDRSMCIKFLFENCNFEELLTISKKIGRPKFFKFQRKFGVDGDEGI